VVEEGTHAALVRAGGEYAHLWQLQAAWYADDVDGADKTGRSDATGDAHGDAHAHTVVHVPSVAPAAPATGAEGAGQ
jgi:hypothetical protein